MPQNVADFPHPDALLLIHRNGHLGELPMAPSQKPAIYRLLMDLGYIVRNADARHPHFWLLSKRCISELRDSIPVVI